MLLNGFQGSLCTHISRSGHFVAHSLLDLRLLLMILGCIAREGPEVGYSSSFC